MGPSIFILGFSIFAMFFGSGNLVFPMQIGSVCLNYWLIGFLGLLVSGIIIPFAGVFAIKRYQGSYDNFFKELGFGANIIIPLILLSLLGAFGIVPRCITVAFGGFHVLEPAIPLWAFSCVFTLICFLTGLKDTRMLNIIGKFMTPVKLGTLALIIIVGILSAPYLSISEYTKESSFKLGLVQGYQTMDLIAGFFFSSLIFRHIEQQCGSSANSKTIFLISAKASLIGASVIALAYGGLVYLGASYSSVIQAVQPTEMLPTLTQHLLGEYSTIVIAFAMGFSCLTTATALNNLYADFLRKLFKLKEAHFCYVLMATSLISFALSLLDFKGIAAFLSPILDVIYPGLIVFTIASLIYPRPHILKRVAFYSITVMMIIFKLI
jgi:LIVCS family branched-chain amino acid:cation transporter